MAVQAIAGSLPAPMLDVWFNDGLGWVMIGTANSLEKVESMLKPFIGVQAVVKDRRRKSKPVARFFHEEGQWHRGCV